MASGSEAVPLENLAASSAGGTTKMDSAQRCRDQASECLHLANLSRNENEAEMLKNISSSWSRLANQIDRYTAIMRKLGK
jgi:hypothetical protein